MPRRGSPAVPGVQDAPTATPPPSWLRTHPISGLRALEKEWERRNDETQLAVDGILPCNA